MGRQNMKRTKLKRKAAYRKRAKEREKKFIKANKKKKAPGSSQGAGK